LVLILVLVLVQQIKDILVEIQTAVHQTLQVQAVVAVQPQVNRLVLQVLVGMAVTALHQVSQVLR
jgi:hypothetical protein